MKAGVPLPIAMSAIEKVFKKYNPGSPFVYRSNDEAYAMKFATEERVANLSAVFAGMAIFIFLYRHVRACILSVAERRSKEIGVQQSIGCNPVLSLENVIHAIRETGIDLDLYIYPSLVLWNESLAARLYLSRNHFLVDFCDWRDSVFY